MRVVILMLVSALFAFAGNASAPVVLVKYNESFHGFMKLPRLAEVVTAGDNIPNLYWPAARLYKTDPESVAALELQRQELLLSLNQLQQYYLQENEPELAASAEHLQTQIKEWGLAEQLFLSLDPDKVRAKAELNPRLRAGQYLLQVSPRSEKIHLVGLAKNKELALSNATDVSDYAKQIKTYEGASSSFLYVVSAGQQPLLTTIGLWNKKRQDVPVGSVLFVPFEQRLLPSGFENLNKQIVDLVLNKVVL